MESVGTRLKNKRLEKGLTLEEVQKKTKIHLNILKSIEDDSLVGVSPVYIKGFLKIYCKFLDIDPREYIPNYKDPQVKPEVITEKNEKKETSSEPSFKKIFYYLPRIRVKTIVIVLAVFFLLLGIFRIGKAISSKRAARVPGAVAKIEKKSPPPTATKSTKNITAKSVKLGIRARENCYLTLKTDGRLVFQGAFRKGISESWEAKEKIEFTLNNAGAVNLQVNGRPISDLGRKGQAIKGLVTREEGLEILR